MEKSDDIRRIYSLIERRKQGDRSKNDCKYHWLEEYYALDDAEEERKKKEEERERKRKAQEKTVVKGVKTSVKESKTKKDSQISLFDMLEDREKTEEKNDCV